MLREHRLVSVAEIMESIVMPSRAAAIGWRHRAHNPRLAPAQAKISSSVGTFLFVITLPMRDTFMRCL
jgi:hypothetical protein